MMLKTNENKKGSGCSRHTYHACLAERAPSATAVATYIQYPEHTSSLGRPPRPPRTDPFSPTPDQITLLCRSTDRKGWFSGADTSLVLGACAYSVMRPSGNIQLEPEPSLCSRNTATYPFFSIHVFTYVRREGWPCYSAGHQPGVSSESSTRDKARAGGYGCDRKEGPSGRLNRS